MFDLLFSAQSRYSLHAMAHAHRPHAFAEDSDLASRTGPTRRDSDWSGHPRTHEEDLSWAAKRAAVNMAAATMHARDGGTGAHSDDVVHLCDAIADELGVYGHDRAELLAAAQLHDIGKVAIPQEVLDKLAPLDDREWALMRQHTLAGEQIVQSVPELHEVARLVRHSHERWDGGGYPDGLSGKEIPLGSRIVFCADAFHAIRSDRSYRRGRAARAALDEVRRNAGSQFDPEVAAALVKAAGQIRSTVRAGAAKGLTTTLRSRRLVSLLLTLALGGSALAAGGSYVLRDGREGDAGAKKAPPIPDSARAARDDSHRPKRGSPATAVRAEQSDTRTPAAPARTRRREAETGSSTGRKRPATRTPAAGPAGAPPAVAKRRRVGRPASPGRSGEAPRRPAQPGKPVGGAPGRSEEAPGRPSQPATRPAKPAKWLPGLLKRPAAGPPGKQKNRR